MMAEERREIEDLLQLLEDHTSVDQCDDRVKLLERLLRHTRSSRDASLAPLFTQRGLRILGRYAFNNPLSAERASALRCLNNLLVRSGPTRQLFVDGGYPREVILLMQDGNPSEALATSSLLLFSAVSTSFDLTCSFNHDDLAGTINKNVLHYAQSPSPPLTDPTSPIIATLSLLSTLAARHEAHAHRFLPSLISIFEILNKVDASSSPLQPPVSVVVSCLASLPIHQSEALPISAVDKLADILRSSIQTPQTPGTERELLPLLMVILHIAQSKSPAARSKLCEYILPSEQDRVSPLGRGTSLPHRLLNLSSTTTEPELREIISTIYFELSDSNPHKFVHNVGFGNAAGFLSSKGMQISPEELNQHQGMAQDASANPITGQLYDNEPQSDAPEMTDEEKEREAERLFVLFERLRANGLVSVENPVAKFQDSGRFEELPDDDSE
ncbi:hypothetical protein ACJZ2D_000238 [Fusarium nematophilum]